MTNSRSLSKLPSPSAISLPGGTAAQRPSTPVNGMLRYNSDIGQVEGYQNGSWGGFGATPLFTVMWWQQRTSIPTGYVPADGQLLSRATYPSAWAGVQNGDVPVATEAAWTGSTTYRGCYTAGDGTSTFRIADLNGKSAGALGAPFLRGDGALSAGTNGLIQADDYKSHTHAQNIAATGGANAGAWASPFRAIYSRTDNTSFTDNVFGGVLYTGGSETRPINVTGCFIIRLFGAVVNTGQVDAAQMATDLNNIKLNMCGRNRIINGDCRVAQRASLSYTTGVGAYSGPDRFISSNTGGGGAYTQSQSTILDGFASKPCITQTVTSAITTTTASNYWSGLIQSIEGYNCSDLIGQQVTISFLWKTNISGTFSLALRDSASAYCYVTTFSATANVVTRIVITTPAIPSAASVPCSNAAGLSLWIASLNTGTFQTTASTNWQNGNFISVAGATNWGATAGNYIAMTDLQLEAGPVATPFERRPITTELALCQRYYERVGATVSNSNGVYVYRWYKAVKRAIPTLAVIAGTIGAANYDTGNDPYGGFRCPSGYQSGSDTDFTMAASCEL